MSDKRLKIVLYREGGGVTARCLDLDLVAHGSTPQEMIHELKYILSGHFLACEENGIQPFVNNTPSPSVYWDMYRAGKTYQLMASLLEKSNKDEERGEIPVTELVVSTVQKLVGDIQKAAHPNAVELSVFTDGDGGATLFVDNTATARRVSVMIEPDGSSSRGAAYTLEHRALFKADDSTQLDQAVKSLSD